MLGLPSSAPCSLHIPMWSSRGTLVLVPVPVLDMEYLYLLNKENQLLLLLREGTLNLEYEYNIDMENEDNEAPNANVENEANVETNMENLNDVRAFYGKRSRRKISKVWDEFSEVEINAVKKVRCKHCKALFKFSGSGTTTQYKRHLLTCPKRRVVIPGQPQLGMHTITPKSENPSTLRPWKYDQSRIRELMSHMIMVHELPFIFVEYEVFNMLMKEAAPDFQKISRNTLKSDCESSYEIEKSRVVSLLKFPKRVSITTDIWRSGQKLEYMVVTCHFVHDWNLYKRVLNFVRVPPPHNGVAVSNALYKCLEEWGLEGKLTSVTMDNASYNNVAVKRLNENLSYLGKLPFEGKLFHVRCCAHILNILVQDGLSEIEGVIHNVRDTVKHIAATPLRIQMFGETVKQMRLSCKKLVLDCCTRWNSTFEMLRCALEFKDAFPRYQEKDTTYKSLPSSDDWEMVQKVCSFLELFNDVTNIISGSEYPTSNLFLPELTMIKESLDEKSISEDDDMRRMALTMKTKFDKYWGDLNLLIAVAAVMDPRNKMKLVEFSFHSIYSNLEATQHIYTVKETLYDMFKEYMTTFSHDNVLNNHNVHAEKNVTSHALNSNVGAKGVTRGRKKFDSYIRNVDVVETLKSELDIYLEEGVYICNETETEYFDPLNWWRANNLKYRTLSRMACDILAIPITSVASEATFSAGGRVIEPHRANLGAETVQMLLCGEDWLRNFYGIKRKTKAMNDGMKEIYLE